MIFPWNPGLFLVAFGVALICDAFLIWVIFRVGSAALTKSNERVVVELRQALEDARKFPSQVAARYEGVHKHLEEHDNLLRAHDGRIRALEVAHTKDVTD